MRTSMIRAVAFVLFVASLLVAPMPARAGANTWTPLGPPAFTNLGALIVDPQTPTTLYAVNTGSPQPGIHKSTDDGQTWQGLDLAAPSGRRDVSFLTVDPTNSDILYAEVGEGDLYKSTDGGDTWQAINRGLQFPPDLFQDIPALAVDPQTPTTLYAGIYGQGLFRSTDGGATWSPIGVGLPPAAEFYLLPFSPGTILIDPQTPSTLYLKVAFDGVFKSVDAGATWQPANVGLPAVPTDDPADDDGQDIFTNWLVPDPQTPTTLYVTTHQGIFKSVDGAASWQPAGSQGLPAPAGGYFALSLVIDPAAPQTLLVTVVVPTSPGARLYGSADGGASWTPVTTSPLVAFDLVVTGDGQSPQTLYLYDRFSGLIYRSRDRGESWANATFGGSNGIPIAGLAVNPHDPAKLYAGFSTGYILRSRDRGQSWSARAAAQPFTNFLIVVDPKTPGRLYATTGSHLLTSEDDGDSWQPLGTGVPTGAFNQLVVDPQTPANLYAQGWFGALRSEDRGQSWIFANAGLPVAPNGQSPTLNYLAIDPQTPATLYAVTQSGLNNHSSIYKSSDGARTWTETGKGAPSDPYAQLLVDPNAPSTLYFLRYSASYLTDTQLYRSVNGGLTWAAVALQGLPNEPDIVLQIEKLAVDPNRSGVLYATVGGGFYSSVDGGDHWYGLPGGLPKDVFVSGGIVLDPATLGRVYLATSDGVQTADLSATLTVAVVVLGTPPAEAWTLTGPQGDFTLPAAGGAQPLGQLTLGAYDLSITPQPDYTVQSVCTQGIGAGAQATAHAAAGQKVICTFFAIAPDAPTSRLPVIGR